MLRKFTRSLYILAAFVIAFLAMPIDRAFAAGNTLYFNPNSQSISINGSFTVSVKAYVETAATNGRVSGVVQYPKSLLRVTATSTSGSNYGTPSITQDANAGTVAFSGSTNPGPSGISQVFSITFQGVGAGKANLNFSGDSSINQSATTRNTASYTIVNPNPTPTPTPTPPKPTTPTTPSQPSTPSAPAAPAPTEPVTTPPDESTVEDNTTVDDSGIITDVTSDPSYTEAVVGWKLSKEQESTELLYGTTKATAATKIEAKKAEDGSYTARLTGLKPGVKYFFTIHSAGKDKKTSTYDSLVITKGYPVNVVVTQSNVPSANAQVRIGGLTRSTNNEGVASFELAEGTYSATLTAQDKSTQTVTFTVAAKEVTDNKAPEAQKYTFNLDVAEVASTDGTPFVTFVFAILGGGALIAGGVFAFINYKRRQFEKGYGSGEVSTMGPAVIVDDGYNWQQAAAPPPPPTLPMPPTGLTPHMDNITVDSSYEEPKDMFELAEERALTPSSPSPVSPQNPTPQVPPQDIPSQKY